MSMLPVGISGEAQYQIERSLRFNSADSAYLNRTPASAGNRKTWTWSGWVKFGSLSETFPRLFSTGTDANNRTEVLFITSTNQVRFLSTVSGVSRGSIDTAAVLRDPSAWYHLVVSLNASATTLVVYINGVQQTLTTTTAIANVDHMVNATNAHNIGRYFGAGNHFSGYLTEINFIDGSALDPTSFGEFNTDTGVWQPKAYTGSYGAQGWFLNFSDNSGVTSTTLGADSSGNGNNWTPNNFSVTAGAGNDSLVDTPTNYGTDTGAGGEVRGNYATLNPLSRWAGGGSVVLSEGNLKAAFTSEYANHGTIAVSSGKYYWEAVITSAGINSTGGGIMTVGQAGSNTSPYLGWVLDVQVGRNYYNNSYTTLTGGSFASGDRLGVAVDMDNGKIWYAKNGTWLGTSADPAAGTGAAQTNVSGEVVPVFYEGNSGFSATWEANFGQRPFSYAAPTGFKALCTQNLPEPTIVDGGQYFNTVLYTGNGSTQSITGVGFQPDWTWIKRRDSANSSGLFDAVRGAGLRLISDATDAEFTDASFDSFDADGFSLADGDTPINASAATYVAWNWKANGAGVSNTAGTITSTVSANTDSGFSIVTYTGTGSAATIGHGLGAVPRMIIVKNRDAADAWQVYHAANTANPETDYLVLNTTAATADAADRWNDTLPTSTVFSIGNGVEVNTNTEDYVAYVFAAIPGYSAFGSYTGNGSADGPFVYTGFRPKYLLIKSSSASATNWVVQDTTRFTYNLVDDGILANTSAAEYSSGYDVDILSNGFKIRRSGGDTNASGGTYIYAAFGDAFKFSLAR